MAQIENFILNLRMINVGYAELQNFIFVITSKLIFDNR